MVSRIKLTGGSGKADIFFEEPGTCQIDISRPGEFGNVHCTYTIVGLPFAHVVAKWIWCNINGFIATDPTDEVMKKGPGDDKQAREVSVILEALRLASNGAIAPF